MARWALLLAPGASASKDQSALVAIDQAATELSLTVRRFDFPYRRTGRRVPDRPEVLVASVKDEAADLARVARARPSRVFAGGRSMGGRICSMAVADGMPAAGLVLVSYPLHPPGKPGQLRTAHFPQLKVPCLFVSGTRDPFASRDELGEAVRTVAGPVVLEWVAGDHSLRGKDKLVGDLVRDWLKGQVP